MRPALLLAVAAAVLLPHRAESQDAGEALKPDPAADMFLLAELSYQEALEAKDPAIQRANFDATLRQLGRFLETHGDHPDAARAWYYTAVCYQKTGREEDARQALQMVITAGKEGPLVATAAFQLANGHYDKGNHASAAPLFATAIAQTDNDGTRHLACYRRAICFQELGKTAETIAALERVLEDADSPFRPRAQVSLAHLYIRNERKPDALALFVQLAESDDRQTRADATLQSALLARELGQRDLAAGWFERILTTPGLEQYRGEAQLALMSGASQAENHPRVVEVFRRGKFRLRGDQEARRLLLAIRSLEALGKVEDTSPLYEELQRVAPGAQTAFEAAYVLLSRRYPAPGPDFAQETRTFLRKYAESHRDDPRVHNARLMLAEVLFKAAQFREATAAYEAIDLRHIDPANHAGLRYRLASARLNSGDRNGGIAAMTDFIDRHPEDPRVTNAYVKRAESFAALGNTGAALDDLDALLAVTSDPILGEYAWAEKAGLYKEAKDYRRLIEAHEALLTKFEDRAATLRAASHFWTGWSRFRLDEFEACISDFERAREGDPQSLGRESTLHLALAQYSLQDQERLQKELRRLLDDYPNSAIPRPVFAWLGVKLSTEGRHDEAWVYLPRGVSFQSPDQTKTVAWRALAHTAVETKNYRAALSPIEILLQRDENEYRRSESFHLQARARFGLGEFAKARESAESGLELKPQGALNGQLRIMLGDIAMAENDPATAARYFVVVAELYSNDPATEQLALERAVTALEKAATPQALEDARNYRNRLEELRKQVSEASNG